jgi:hypothetical protein
MNVTRSMTKYLCSIHMSPQELADVREVMRQSWQGTCDANLDQSAFNELLRQLECQDLPEATRIVK